MQSARHEEEDREYFDLMEASDLIAGNVEEQTNLPLPEEQLKQFLQHGDGLAGDGRGNKRMQILMLSSATVLSIVNGMRHGMHM